VGDGVLAPERRALTIGIALCVTIIAFQGVGVVTALPRVARDLEGLQHYGWGVTAFALAAVVGTVLGGREADRSGLLRPLLWGALLFAVGSAACAAAPSWGAFLAGRAVQGGGDGAIAAAAYAAVGRAYPDALRPRMLATMSTAWIVHSLVGPAAAGVLADAGLWRVVFVALVPILVVALVLAVPPLRAVPAPAARADRHGVVRDAVLAAAGLALLLTGLGRRDPVGLALAAAGVVPLALALPRLLPRGTLRLRPGVGLGVASRGLLAGSFLGVEAFLTLGLVEAQGWPASRVGLAITGAALTWTAGSWLQARLDARRGVAGRAPRMVLGFLVLGAGIALAGLGVVGVLPAVAGPLGWALGGLGIGMAYATAATTAFAATAGGDEGQISASLQVVETMAVSAVTGVAGAIVALGFDRGWAAEATLGPVFAFSVVVTVLGAARWRATVRA
jgi:MFS family permease